MKKLLALLLALMMLFSVATVFAGCEDSGKKKSSSSKNDDDEDEDEDEDDEDEDEDKDNEDEDEDKDGEDEDDNKDGEDENNGDEDVDVTEPKATEPEPTEPEPTEPEPTEVESELLDAPYEVFDESLNNFVIGAQILSGSEYKYFEVGIQNISENEGILYYYDETEELMAYYCDGVLELYVYQDDAFVLDTATSDTDKMTKYQSMAYILSMFVDYPSLNGAGTKYELLGEEDDMAVYNVYDANGNLARVIYIDIATGICTYILDQNGNDIMWIEDVYEAIDFASYIQ